MPPIQKLELRGLSRIFGSTSALYDFSLDIAGGSFVTLLGPSGCGKSTALNCIAGLLDLTEGEIRLNGAPIQHVSAEKRGFGMVFQNYALFPHLTVSRNVSYGLETHHMPHSERASRVHAALDLVQLNEAEFGNRFPAQLSGGQQQRLAFARAIVLEPSVLLLDEPLSNLDTKLRTEMRIEIKHLHKRLGLTTIYVTHDQGEALSMSDQVVVMRKGRIVQVGTPPDIYTCPHDLYVADFMGYVNQIPVTLVDRSSGQWIVQTEAGVRLNASVTTEAATSWPIGRPLVACARPDDLWAGTASSASTNRLRGIVHLVEYVGQAFEAVVRLENDEQCQVLIHSEQPLDIERPVEFGIRPARLLLFPAERLGDNGQ